jgi:hypothetical protein
MMKPELRSVVVLGSAHDPGLRAFCDRIVPRSENDDNHDRFELPPFVTKGVAGTKSLPKF